MHAPVLFLMLRAAVEHQPTSGAPTLGDPLANLAATPGAFSGTLGHSRTTTDGVLARKKKEMDAPQDRCDRKTITTC